MQILYLLWTAAKFAAGAVALVAAAVAVAVFFRARNAGASVFKSALYALVGALAVDILAVFLVL